MQKVPVILRHDTAPEHDPNLGADCFIAVKIGQAISLPCADKARKLSKKENNGQQALYEPLSPIILKKISSDHSFIFSLIMLSKALICSSCFFFIAARLSS